MKLNTHLLLFSRSRISGALLPVPVSLHGVVHNDTRDNSAIDEISSFFTATSMNISVFGILRSGV